MILTWALIAVLISGAQTEPARGGDLVECEPQRVTGDGRHWAYRLLDGRACWYPGRPGKPKNELFWERAISSSTHQPLDHPETEAEIERSEPDSRFVAAPTEIAEITKAMPEESRATFVDHLLAFTCCWPELEQVAVLPQLTPKGGEPPAWPLALLPLAIYALWRIAKPKGLRAFAAAIRRAGRIKKYHNRRASSGRQVLAAPLGYF